MSLLPANVRPLLAVALAVAVASSAGCSWFRGQTGYETSPESRPLEVPPDLTQPRTDPAMQVPQVNASAPAGVPAAGEGFSVADSADSVWRRIGLALERIEGVAIANRAQLIGAYEVQYRGESFLVRAQAEGEGTRVTAVGADGQPLSSAAAAQLLGLLRQRIG